jgi:hypothetical protein
MASRYFSGLFTKGPSLCPDELADLFYSKITPEINVDLCKPYIEEEIGNAPFHIGPLKAPGPDGFPARFFQRNWGLMKPDIIIAVQKFLKQVSCRKVSTIQVLFSYPRYNSLNR